MKYLFYNNNNNTFTVASIHTTEESSHFWLDSFTWHLDDQNVPRCPLLSLSLFFLVYFLPLYIFDFHLYSHILCWPKLSAQRLENILLRFLTCHTATADVYTHLRQIHLDKSYFIFLLNSVAVSHRNYFFFTLTCFCGPQVSLGIEVKAVASCPRLLLFVALLVWSSKLENCTCCLVSLLGDEWGQTCASCSLLGSSLLFWGFRLPSTSICWTEGAHHLCRWCH